MDARLRRIKPTLTDLRSDFFITLLPILIISSHTLTLLAGHLQLACQLDTDFIDAVLGLERIDEVDHLVEDLLDERLTQLIALQQRYLLQKRALGDFFAGGAIRVAVADGCTRLTIAQPLLELGEELTDELRGLIPVAGLDEVQTIELIQEPTIQVLLLHTELRNECSAHRIALLDGVEDVPQAIEGLADVAIGDDSDLSLGDLARLFVGELDGHHTRLQLHIEEVVILRIGLQNNAESYPRSISFQAFLEELICK